MAGESVSMATPSNDENKPKNSDNNSEVVPANDLTASLGASGIKNTGKDLQIPGIASAHKIGSGGNAVVYRAYQPDLDRDVVVKLLVTVDSDQTRRRFNRERRAMGRLSRVAGIAPLYESGFTPTGQPFLVMPYYESGSLGSLLEREGRLGARQIAQLGAKICRSLDAAHKSGVLHRDLKPDNVLLDLEGEPHIADFGIAQIVGELDGQSKSITMTPLYSAPEVFASQESSVQSDVYSIGAMLFALANGSPAFGDSKNTLFAVMSRVNEEPVPSLEHLLPKGLSDVIAKAMAKKPSDRYSSANELAMALDPFAMPDSAASPQVRDIQRSLPRRQEAPPPVAPTAPSLPKEQDVAPPEQSGEKHSINASSSSGSESSTTKRLGMAIAALAAVIIGGIVLSLTISSGDSSDLADGEVTSISTGAGDEQLGDSEVSAVAETEADDASQDQPADEQSNEASDSTSEDSSNDDEAGSENESGDSDASNSQGADSDRSDSNGSETGADDNASGSNSFGVTPTSGVAYDRENPPDVKYLLQSRAEIQTFACGGFYNENGLLLSNGSVISPFGVARVPWQTMARVNGVDVQLSNATIDTDLQIAFFHTDSAPGTGVPANRIAQAPYNEKLALMRSDGHFVPISVFAANNGELRVEVRPSFGVKIGDIAVDGSGDVVGIVDHVGRDTSGRNVAWIAALAHTIDNWQPTAPVERCSDIPRGPIDITPKIDFDKHYLSSYVQLLMNYYVNEDWERVRQFQPERRHETDSTLESGWGPLNKSFVYPISDRPTQKGAQVRVALVGHETWNSQPITTLWCVDFDIDFSNQTLTQQNSVGIHTVDENRLNGTIDPTELKTTIERSCRPNS